MPRIIPLAEIHQMEADEPIICTVGTLKKLFEPKTGTNSNGEWSIQHGTIEKDGASIDLFIKDRPAIAQAWRGREIIIEAHKGDKGWSGVYAYDDTYKGKTTRKIKITPTGQVALTGDAPAAEPPPSKTPAQHTPAQPKPAAPPNIAAAQPGSRAKIKEAVAAATQIANMQLLSLNTVENYVAPRFKKKSGRELTVDEKHAWAMNMTIQLCRDNMQWAMPTAEIGDKEKEKPAPPPPPPPSDNDGGAPDEDDIPY